MDTRTAIAEASRTGLERQGSNSRLSLSQRLAPEKPASAMAMEAIEEIESYKGKTYAQVCRTLFAGKSPDEQRAKAHDLIGKIAALFDSMGSEKLILIAVRRSRDTEYTGTAYSPLPDIGALSRVVNEVLRDFPNERDKSSALPDAIETKEDEYGVTICDDCEKIVRDRYFFRSLCNQGYDLYTDTLVMALADEAFSLMDDKHKASHGRAPDDAGRMLVMRHYFENVELPDRKSKPSHEIEKLRAHGVMHRHSWSRWDYTSSPFRAPYVAQD